MTLSTLIGTEQKVGVLVGVIVGVEVGRVPVAVAVAVLVIVGVFVGVSVGPPAKTKLGANNKKAKNAKREKPLFIGEFKEKRDIEISPKRIGLGLKKNEPALVSSEIPKNTDNDLIQVHLELFNCYQFKNLI